MFEFRFASTIYISSSCPSYYINKRTGPPIDTCGKVRAQASLDNNPSGMKKLFEKVYI